MGLGVDRVAVLVEGGEHHHLVASWDVDVEKSESAYWLLPQTRVPVRECYH